MSEHTPGPWEWYWRHEDGEANCGVYYMKRPGQAYAVARCPRYEKREQWEANARLIAAAPELLEACKATLAIYDGPQPMRHDELDMLRSAIAKATEGGKRIRCEECGEDRPDDDRVAAGMKCGRCAYGAE